MGRYAPVRSTGTSRFQPLAYRDFLRSTGTSHELIVPCPVFFLRLYYIAQCAPRCVGLRVRATRLSQFARPRITLVQLLLHARRYMNVLVQGHCCRLLFTCIFCGVFTVIIRFRPSPGSFCALLEPRQHLQQTEITRCMKRNFWPRLKPWDVAHSLHERLENEPRFSFGGSRSRPIHVSINVQIKHVMYSPHRHRCQEGVRGLSCV